MEDMLASGQNDDLFGSEETPQEQQNSTTGLDGMLAGSDNDDDLFGASAPAPAPAAEAPQSSALNDWERTKREEIAELDRKNDEADAELKNQAREKLDKFNETLRKAQESREQHNKELEEQFLAEQKSEAKSWEKVVGYIDFNRTDLHERDVSKMKTLLLQLKH